MNIGDTMKLPRKQWIWIGLAGLALFLAITGAAYADSYEIVLYPFSSISGPAGSTIGWGNTITNNDKSLWLYPTVISDDIASPYATPDASVFPFTPVGPDATQTVPFDGTNGLYALTWDPLAPIGTTVDGAFIVSFEWWDGDPLNGGSWVKYADDAVLSYHAIVEQATVVPEPSGWILLLTALAVLPGAGKLRRHS
jgi:hypothetical protein